MKRFFFRIDFILLFYVAMLNIGCVNSVDNNLVMFKVPEVENKLSGKTRLEQISFDVPEEEGSKKTFKKYGQLKIVPDAKANLLLAHGFMCCEADIRFLRFLFPNYNIMTFDLRAHGKNIEDEICTFGQNEYLDIASAARYFKNRKDPELQNKPLFLYGFSMGAVASIIAQSKDPNLFDAMILDCPFESSDKLLERGFSNLKLSFFGYEVKVPLSWALNSCAYNSYVQSFIKNLLKTISHMDATKINTKISRVYPDEAIKKVNIPVFIIGCKRDDKAPVEAVRKIYDGAQGFKRGWLETEGKGHYGSLFDQPELYQQRALNFFDMVQSGNYKKLAKEEIFVDEA